ncbi:hypothetical protein H072_1537 [Dactylellina haptotyla CBS 200.50]|uniref:Aminotransferase class I/classII large domain-containing protein n=1 Tax=Dactylellina haptotyla (strain CBS 200.50) TaxID=1284197 RepID=S8AU42_DACHA|nr:hypothetical protein H072_1537 [Dactylellina haptotyla CBS 200.50]
MAISEISPPRSASQDLAFFLKHFVECNVRPQFLNQTTSVRFLEYYSDDDHRLYGNTAHFGFATKERMDAKLEADEPAAPAPVVPKPQPIDLSHHLSPYALGFAPSRLKRLYKYGSQPGIVNLAGGMPHASYFPFDTINASVLSSDRFGQSMNSKFLMMLKSIAGNQHLTIPKYDAPQGDPLNDIYLAKALQYGQCDGLPGLLEFVKDFALNHQHQGKIPYDTPAVMMTCGNTDAIAKSLDILADRTRGDKILAEKFVYSGSTQAATVRGIEVVPVDVDKEGMVVEGDEGLQGILESWDVSRDGPRPHLMYTVTMGQNPTSGVLGLERRKQIYALCQKYDIIILEDDPYWFLQYDIFSELPDNQKFLSTLTPSYLTLDTDGRVLRFDTFSKTMAPGTRLGWVVGHPKFIERILRVTEMSTQMPSGAVQALVGKLLVNTWGMSGWVTWLNLLRHEYEQRMNFMCAALEESRTVTIINVKNVRMRDDDGNLIEGEKYSLVHKAVKELYEFERPMGGMFVWVRVYFEIHRLYDGTNGKEIMEALWNYLAKPEFSCLVAPGEIFGATDELSDREAWKYLRLCFAAVDIEELKRGSGNFGKGIKEFFELTEFPRRPDPEVAGLKTEEQADVPSPQFC